MSVDLNPVNNYQQTSAPPAAGQQNQPAENGAAAAVNTDVYVKSQETKENYKPDHSTIQKMLRESEQKVESFRLLMERMFNQQGITFEQSIGRLREALGPDGVLSVEVDEETRLKAQQEISEDGYWGVQQTSDRIMDFAKALSGGDPSKVELLRSAVQKGFENAEKQWGDKLPEISQRTYDEIMRRFDQWAEEGMIA